MDVVRADDDHHVKEITTTGVAKNSIDIWTISINSVLDYHHHTQNQHGSTGITMIDKAASRNIGGKNMIQLPSVDRVRENSDKNDGSHDIDTKLPLFATRSSGVKEHGATEINLSQYCHQLENDLDDGNRPNAHEQQQRQLQQPCESQQIRQYHGSDDETHDRHDNRTVIANVSHNDGNDEHENASSNTRSMSCRSANDESPIPQHGRIHKIDTTSVQRIVAGQAVTDLASAVKELVDNALDAASQNINSKSK
jgi:hypothetical protein